ncbi:MAG: helix-turn-helix transcriptional regulator [Candidatus Zixiibacteriota bacterium]
MSKSNLSLSAFGERLKDLRIKLGYTQPDLANILDVKRQTISSWEQGTTSPDVGKLLTFREHAASQGLIIDIGILLGDTRLDFGETPFSFFLNFLKQVDEMGLRGVYHSRREALDSFRLALERELESITIVSSSLSGVLRVASAKVSELLRRKAGEVRNFRILMTEPTAMGRLREAQEGRAEGSIASEISENVARLVKDWNLKEENIRFYKGAPTIFLLFTSERLLLNPYTYQTEAYKTLTLEVANTNHLDDIYSQYVENHFQRPWNSSNCISYLDYTLEIKNKNR